MFDVSKFAVKAVKAWVAIRGRFLRAKVALGAMLRQPRFQLVVDVR